MDDDRANYEAELRLKLKAEYDQKREEIYARDAQKPITVPDAKPNQYQMDLAERYPIGITEESELLDNREVKRLIVKRKEGVADQYSRVKWNWGGVYYFKNESSTSKEIFDTETKW